MDELTFKGFIYISGFVFSAMGLIGFIFHWVLGVNSLITFCCIVYLLFKDKDFVVERRKAE